MNSPLKKVIQRETLELKTNTTLFAAINKISENVKKTMIDLLSRVSLGIEDSL